MAGFVEHRGAGRRFEVEFQRVGAGVAGQFDEAGGGVDGARRADGNEQIAGSDGGLDAVHVVGHFAEPDDIGAQTAGLAAGGAGWVVHQRPAPGAGGAAAGAQRTVQFAVHVDKVVVAGAVVQIIDILGDEEEPAGPLRLKPGQGAVGGVGRHLAQEGPALVIELLHQCGVAPEGLRGGDIFHPVAFPQAIVGAKRGHAGFSRNAGAGEDDDGWMQGHAADIARRRATRQGVDMTGKLIRVGVLGAGGRMGQAIITALADRAGLVLAAAIERAGHPACGAPAGPGHDPALVVCSNVGAAARLCDVLIDFTSPAALAATLEAAQDARCAVVVGTTGLETVHHAAIDAAAAIIPILQASNTSLGVALLARLVEDAARALGPDWDIEIAELHHRMKVDSPSGTALTLGEAAARGRGVNLATHSERGRDGITGARVAGQIGFASLRGGTAAGDHMVLLAGAGERIELWHRAEDRSIFAAGALKAAQWLAGRPPRRYAMNDVLGSEMPGNAR